MVARDITQEIKKKNVKIHIAYQRFAARRKGMVDLIESLSGQQFNY